MQELRQAFNDYMKQMAEQNAQNGQQPDGQNKDHQSLGEEDLERMMKNLEDMAEKARASRPKPCSTRCKTSWSVCRTVSRTRPAAAAEPEMMQAMEELGDMVGDQQKLMDDTFNERRGDEPKAKASRMAVRTRHPRA